MSDYPYQHYALGHQRRGSVAVVTLKGNAANVRLLDGTNLSSYRRGAAHRYLGGLAKSSPVRLEIPRDGTWHLVVDLIGLGGQVRSSVFVEPPPPQPLPAIPQPSAAKSPSLQTIADNVAAVAPDSIALSKAYDVFISHAAEDKDPLVRDLAHALTDRGLAVWYDEFELRLGDSLRRKIDAGLSSSRFGLVVLSPSFLDKNWPQYELDGLVTREMAGEQQIILPVWHDLDADQVRAYSPSLADKLALNAANLTINQMADEITQVVRGELATEI